MLALKWECVDSKLNKILGILEIFMLASLFFTRGFGRYKKGEFNRRHYILYLPLFMEFTSAEYYISTDEKSNILYVSSSCTFTLLTVTDIIEYDVEVIEKKKFNISTSN